MVVHCIVVVTRLRGMAHYPDESLHQDHAVGAPLLLGDRQLQPLQHISVYTFRNSASQNFTGPKSFFY